MPFTKCNQLKTAENLMKRFEITWQTYFYEKKQMSTFYISLTIFSKLSFAGIFEQTKDKIIHNFQSLFYHYQPIDLIK